MDRDFKKAYLEGYLAALDDLLRRAVHMLSRQELQLKRRDIQAELDALKLRPDPRTT